MKKGLLSTAGFRYTALAAVVFAASALVLAVVGYFSVQNRMEQQLRERVAAETSQLLGDYRDQGLEELRHDIRERLERSPAPRLFYSIHNRQGESIFDSMELPARDGWSRLQPETGRDRLLLTTSLEDGYRLGVAASMGGMIEFGHAFRQTTALSLIALLVLSLLAGMVVSWRVMLRLERFQQTADRVGQGGLSERIPTDGLGDDFARLAQTFNHMLDRIEQLMNDVRYSTISIAHDLRTPLGRLRQRLEKLEGLQTSERTRAMSRDAIDALDEALQTFDALLKISELETGSSSIGQERIDMQVLLGDLMEVYAPLAQDRGHRLQFLSGAPAEVIGDRPLLNQLFVNLIENAIRHNPHPVEIVVQLALAGDSVRIVVQDNGVGVPDSALAQLVKPFYREQGSRSSPGTGLGLSLAARIARRHGGSLDIVGGRPGLLVEVSLPRASLTGESGSGAQTG